MGVLGLVVKMACVGQQSIGEKIIKIENKMQIENQNQNVQLAGKDAD